jgi:tetratricopeptide (TPR) repeat protein
LAITVPPERKPRFVQVLGAGGIEYGLAMYRRWEDLERMYRPADSPLEILPPDGGNSFLFDEITQLPFDDVEALEKFGWEVAGDEAYPAPMVFTRRGDARRPARADLLWYEAALQAIHRFVGDHLQSDGQGDFLPVKAKISVLTHRGEVAVAVEYPGGTLPKETRPTGLGEWFDLEDDEGEEDELSAPPYDRRAMEGMMRLFGGGPGGSPLDEAQDLMYQAWEEPNPASRIKLARQALSISPDCADAYVLLAEEEAGSLGRALEYYQKGVEAGERALGKGYFKENRGYFWGLLETRPYMRARQGLAETLWELGRPEETLKHYQEMLRLNPNDNQGIRYSLASLLLALNRDDDLGKLLKRYAEDAFASLVYTRALWLYRREGPSAQANQALKEALQQNPHVPAYLSGRKRIPNRMPETIGFGDVNEAIDYAGEHLKYWRQTPGAVDWLQQHSGAPDAGAGPKPKRPKRK